MRIQFYLLVLVCCLMCLAKGQDTFTHPDAPQPKVHKHNYWHVAELTLVGASLGADAITTRQLHNRGFHEMNPLIDAGSDGEVAAYFGADFTLLLYANHLMRNHTKIRHVTNWVVIGGETYWAVHNLELHKPPLFPTKPLCPTCGSPRMVNP